MLAGRPESAGSMAEAARMPADVTAIPGALDIVFGEGDR